MQIDRKKKVKRRALNSLKNCSSHSFFHDGLSIAVTTADHSGLTLPRFSPQGVFSGDRCQITLCFVDGLIRVCRTRGHWCLPQHNPTPISGERSLTPEEIVDLYCAPSVRARVCDNGFEATETS